MVWYKLRYLQETDSASGEVSGQLQRPNLATGGGWSSSKTVLLSSTAAVKDEAEDREGEGSEPKSGRSLTSSW